MKIADIQRRATAAKNDALAALGVSPEQAAAIELAPSPQPEMGDVGFPCFALARSLRKAPPAIASELAAAIGAALAPGDVIAEALAVGPYVNFRFDKQQLIAIVVGQALDEGARFGSDCIAERAHVMIEYSAPNTNKPQHLGHVRNNLLGAAVSSILAFAGHRVTRVNLINDRGVHICKSMLGYRLWGDGETPQSSGVKGDHLVGKYYVMFEREFATEYARWLEGASDAAYAAWRAAHPPKKGQSDEEHRKAFAEAYKDDYFNGESKLGGQARQMLRDWEAGEPSVVELWKTMNSWVFAGFDETYARLGVGFDRVYKESELYTAGRDIVLRGLEDGKFRRLDDGAVVCDLGAIGLKGGGDKVLLRSDGTSVYMTQDLGTALARFDEYHMDRMVYVVADEQDHHFRVLFGVLGLLRPELQGNLFHLSYGMVLLPEGKMKSREGKVVDADDLVAQMIELARAEVNERYAELSAEEAANRARVIGLAALKYYVLDFNPRTTVHFDPKKSIDFAGRTGPYCLYGYARIQSIFREVARPGSGDRKAALAALGTPEELSVVARLNAWPDVVALAARDLDPGKVTEHLFELCKAFSTLYNAPGHRIRELEGPRREGLLLLASAVASTLEAGLSLLGIETVDQM